LVGRSLALFPIKRTDQKAAFVIGLALLMQTVFNLTYFVANEEYFSIAVQSAGVLVCFYHYGLVNALLNTLKNKSNKE
jgi:hypothetical protein